MGLEDRILFLTWPQTWKNPLPAGLSREAQSLEAVQQCIVSPSLETLVTLVMVVTGFDFWRCWFLVGVLVHRTDSRWSEVADAVSEVRCGFHSRGGLAATVRSNRSRARPETGPAADVLSSPCCQKLGQNLGKDSRVQTSVRFLVLASSCAFFQSGGQELGITSC